MRIDPAPVTFTEASTGSEVELSVMVGATEDVFVKVSDDETGFLSGFRVHHVSNFKYF